MNANSKQPAQTIEQWLRNATTQLKDAGIPTARLDAELILAHVLGKTRTWLIAHLDEPIAIERADGFITKRAGRVPLAYLTGHKEFYGRDFTVTPNVLIPRPETEEIIEQLRSLHPEPGQQLIDAGTGSGAIAITAALEFPGLTVEATDVSKSALEIARINAQDLGAHVNFYESSLLANCTNTYDFILANLPYVDHQWERSPETDHEPALALFADDSGLELIKQLIVQCAEKLKPSGYMLLESDPEQHTAIIDFARQCGFKHTRTNDYIVTLQRPVTV